jgi:hypothetical protein
VGRARTGGVGAGVELAGEGDVCLAGLESDLGGTRLARRSRRGCNRDSRSRGVRGSGNGRRGRAGAAFFGFGAGFGFGFGAGFGFGTWVSFGVGSVAVALVVGGETAAVVVGFVFTFALATGLGSDAFFFAGFGLAAAVVVAFGTIGTTVSTASVAMTGFSVAADGAVETDSSTARSRLRASSTPSAVPAAASRSPAAPASTINAGRRTGKRQLPPVCQ